MHPLQLKQSFCDLLEDCFVYLSLGHCAGISTDGSIALHGMAYPLWIFHKNLVDL
jgi:hypothetical protein